MRIWIVVPVGAAVVAGGLAIAAASSGTGHPARAAAPVTTSPATPRPRPAPTAAPGRREALYRAPERPRPLRMLVVGDSVGVSFARGLAQWAARTGGGVVKDDARPWCSLGRYLPSDVLGPQRSAAGCDDWTTRWAADVRTFDPDVVFVMYTIWEVEPRLLPGARDYARPGNPALDAWQLSEYRAAADVLSARGAPVVWFSIACENGRRIRRGEPLWYVNRRTLPALARSRPAVRLFDLDAMLCGRRLVTGLGGVRDLRPDGAHYSPDGALALARRLMPIVLGREPLPPYAAS